MLDPARPTCNGTEQSQGGSFPVVLVDHALGGRHRDRDGQGDRLVELSSPGLYGDDGGHGYTVTVELRRQLGGNRVGLERK